MHLSTLSDADSSSCTLTFDEADGWLRATWRGYIDPAEALCRAESSLTHAAAWPCPYLLNDNGALRGPWFDSVAWLERVWRPHAVGLGLRYIAHVVPADTHTDILTLTFPHPALADSRQKSHIFPHNQAVSNVRATRLLYGTCGSQSPYPVCLRCVGWTRRLC